ncbi:MAG: gamma-glutamylcyclotransferase family protein [Novosphingobium sp.]
MRRCWLFFYGTLMQDHDNALTRTILPMLEGGRWAFVSGRLLAARSPYGWYPVLCAGNGRVAGRLYRAGPRFTARHLRLLDAYEEWDQRRPARSEYRRMNVRVAIAGGGMVTAHAYRHNRPVHAGLRVIPGGDFNAFVARRRLCAFGSSAGAVPPRPVRSPALPMDARP